MVEVWHPSVSNKALISGSWIRSGVQTTLFAQVSCGAIAKETQSSCEQFDDGMWQGKDRIRLTSVIGRSRQDGAAYFNHIKAYNLYCVMCS